MVGRAADNVDRLGLDVLARVRPTNRSSLFQFDQNV